MRINASQLGIVLLFAACQNTDKHSVARDVADGAPWYDIGAVHRTVTTSSPKAQLWFDRGLALTYGFNHEEAIVCFDKALSADPNCAMALWGKANALGPNYNDPSMTDGDIVVAYDTIQRALATMSHCTSVEQDLIRAAAVRFPSPTAQPRESLNAAYSEALGRARLTHPDDSDIAALYTESLMQLTPWKLWTPDGEMTKWTPKIRQELVTALARWPNHPALCHLYIHAMEAGPEVQLALPEAQRLESLCPGLGHLVHMPSHIYVWTGRYQDVVRINQLAVRQDKAYVEHAGRDNFYTLYRLHNLHFVAYGAMWEGRRELALQSARQIVNEVRPEFAVELADFLDIFMATPLHVMARFGMWEEILLEPEPMAELLAAKAVRHYARALALAALGRVMEAEAEQANFLRARTEVPDSRMLFQNPVTKILEVARALLAGEIEYRKGNYDLAFKLLREAVVLDKQMNYDEPWGWMEPVSHALGALLLEQGHYEEALKVYQEDLARYPENGWALHGLAECQEQLGLIRDAEATRARFEKAWARADIKITGSCFCRTGV